MLFRFWFTVELIRILWIFILVKSFKFFIIVEVTELIVIVGILPARKRWLGRNVGILPVRYMIFRFWFTVELIRILWIFILVKSFKFFIIIEVTELIVIVGILPVRKRWFEHIVGM